MKIVIPKGAVSAAEKACEDMKTELASLPRNEAIMTPINTDIVAFLGKLHAAHVLRKELGLS